MLKKLQDKWNVSGWRLLLILITFTLAGSLTGYLGKKIMGFTGIDTAGIYLPIYLIVVTLIWPLMVIMVSVPMGQFVFFKKYLVKMASRLRGKKNLPVDGGQLAEAASKKQETKNKKQKIKNEKQETRNKKQETKNKKQETGNKKRVAIFASGTGSNTQQIINYFNSGNRNVLVSLIVCNKPDAGVLKIAQKEEIDILLIHRDRFFHGDAYIPVFQEANIDLIVLAGFLWKIPLPLIHIFPKRIINIHPALLPKFGGKNMYGNKVHEMVINAGKTESGITIHYVDEHYDEGDIIFQATCEVLPGDTPETLARRIHQLEHEYYPKVIEKLTGKL